MTARARSAWLERLTWEAAREALPAYPVTIIPVGAAAKEHGRHLPLNNDAILAEALARRVAARVPVLVAPLVNYGYYPAFVAYAGSTDLRLETARDMMVEICRSLSRHGARRLYALNTGISTCKSFDPARQILAEEGIEFEYLRLDEALREVKQRIEEQEGGTHADEIETSMMLYLAPRKVDMTRARKDYTPGPGPLTPDPDDRTGVYSPTGAWGDPTLATREKGRQSVAAVVSHVVAFLKKWGQTTLFSFTSYPPRFRNP